jgi:hypothetical protein
MSEIEIKITTPVETRTWTIQAPANTSDVTLALFVGDNLHTPPYPPYWDGGPIRVVKLPQLIRLRLAVKLFLEDIDPGHVVIEDIEVSRERYERRLRDIKMILAEPAEQSQPDERSV